MTRSKGFTLVEILAAMGLLSIVVLVIATIFRTSTDTMERADSLSQKNLEARIVLNMIAQDIKGAIIDNKIAEDISGNPVRLNLVGGEDTGRPFIAFIAPSYNSGEQDLCEIGYWLDLGSNFTDPSDNMLMRYYVTDQSPSWLTPISPLTFFSSPLSTELAQNVKGLEILYWGDNTEEWVDTNSNGTDDALTTWDSSSGSEEDRLPQAVKITIWVSDRKNSSNLSRYSRVVKVENS